MTERTYRRDLGIVCNHFVSAFRTTGSSLESGLNSLISGLSSMVLEVTKPIYELHGSFLRDLESRLSAWDQQLSSAASVATGNSSSSAASTPGSSVSNEMQSATQDNTNFFARETMAPTYRVGDLFVANLKMLPLYRRYLGELERVMLTLEQCVHANPSIEHRMRELEAKKLCYLPFYAFLLKPQQRLLQYRSLLERLMRHYADGYIDMQDCRVAHARLLDVIQSQWDSYKRTENLYKLLEIQRDLTNLQTDSGAMTEDEEAASDSHESSVKLGQNREEPYGPLVRPGRNFIREGWLQKLSKKGYQQRMFFLFSDQLIYASRISSQQLRFKARWVEDISRSILAAKASGISGSSSVWFKNAGSNKLLFQEELNSPAGSTSSSNTSSLINSLLKNPSECMCAFFNTYFILVSKFLQDLPKEEKQKEQNCLVRATTSVHVCWHRNLTYSMQDVLRVNEYQTSGYLLRKFKNSNGWQKLWVVFTQLTLYFHKSCQDENPLASLPLLGYSVSLPDPTADQIRRPFVFKLQFKNHVYFFRGDTEHAFKRWFDFLCTATGASTNNRKTASNSQQRQA
ncbi:hypothetical protein Ciccas_005530 [Cichlidogyrus casuarinus]|uniref:Uncharacterized protein n=1 Tax=Cichlidogyrus casuarinus TaxID=1844966 RepID=A0ABD2Q8E2_9PLAT